MLYNWCCLQYYGEFQSAYGLTPLPLFVNNKKSGYDEKMTQRQKDFEGCRIAPKWGADLNRNHLPI